MNENWNRFEAILQGRIPDCVSLTHTWGYHPAHALKLLGRPMETDADLLEYKNLFKLPIGLRVSRISPFGANTALASDGTEHYVPNVLAVGASLKPYLDESDFGEFVAQTRQVVKFSHQTGLAAEGRVISCIHALSTALGLEGLAIAAYEYADWLEEAMELIERRNRRAISAMIDAKVDIVLFDGDCAYKNGLMLSPEMMRRFWFDRTCQTVKLLHDAEVWAYYHTDGKVDEVLPMLIELGFAAFHGCEKAANDLAHLKREFGEQITLIGNADHAELTLFSPERIITATEQMMRVGAAGGRFIADVNTSVPAQAPLENYEAFVQAVRGAGVYNGGGTLTES